MPRRPLVLGHRGASAQVAENTVAAFERAREIGADGVELDVRRSADGVLMVHHDPEIADLGPLVELAFADVRSARPAIPTFAEALRACRGLVVNAEVKCLPWEIDADHDGTVMRATVDALAGYDGEVIVSSFALGAVDLAREYAEQRSASRIETGWLTHGQEVGAAAEVAADHGHRWLNPDLQAALAAGADAVEHAHAAGLLVSAWTVDDPTDARTLAASGVDILISNVPDVLISVIDGA
jgi:glycerophosphoryl diester phosphodiesterase